MLQRRWLSGLICVFLVACLVGGMYLMIRLNWLQQAIELVNKNTPTPLFLLLMLVLPLVGVPLSVFIFVLGIKFGIGYGILLLEIIMPLHILTSYLIARHIRKPMTNFLVNWKDYRIPEIPENKLALFSFLLLAVPVFPYAVKNYILPLAGVPFRYCMWMNWGIQGTLSIPFVILGKSTADMNLLLFVMTMAVLVILFFVLRRLRRWYDTL